MQIMSQAAEQKMKNYRNDQARWNAVVRRDREADGKFYYSVVTTGVYCRPSCASRRARRENVRFYESAAAAEHAGFRACKRCKPGQSSLAEEQRQKILAACKAMQSAQERPNFAALAHSAGMSRYHFHRLFKAVTGLTPGAYAQAHRSERVRRELASGRSVTQAIYDAGFNSAGRFYSQATEILGMTPTAFRRGGENIAMRFAVGECSLGSILVAATAKGVCAILLGDDPGQLLRDLQDRFPRAELIGGDRSFEDVVARIIGFVEQPSRDCDLELDVRGTAFQQRVWQALRKIPAGSTASYSEIAEQLGSPRAVRAVAQACGANPLAVAIPCHRVVRNDGALAGYRWGIERKRALLEREQAPKKS